MQLFLFHSDDKAFSCEVPTQLCAWTVQQLVLEARSAARYAGKVLT